MMCGHGVKKTGTTRTCTLFYVATPENTTRCWIAAGTSAHGRPGRDMRLQIRQSKTVRAKRSGAVRIACQLFQQTCSQNERISLARHAIANAGSEKTAWTSSA